MLCKRSVEQGGTLRYFEIEAIETIPCEDKVTIYLLKAGIAVKSICCSCYKKEVLIEELWEGFKPQSSSILFDKNDEVAILSNYDLKKKKGRFGSFYRIVDISCAVNVLVCDYDWQNKMALLTKTGKRALPYWFYLIDYIGGVDFAKMCNISEKIQVSVSDMLRIVRKKYEDRKVLAFYGNCQITAYNSLLVTSEELLEKYIVINMVPVQIMGNYKVHLTEAFFREIDVFVYQRVRENNKYGREVSTDILAGYLRTDARKICIPNAYFTGYFPQICVDPYNIDQPEICGKAFSSGDKNVRRMTDEGMTVEEISAILDTDYFYSVREVKANYDETMESLRQREKDSDVKISDFIEEWFRKRQLFFTENHPTCFLLNEVLKRVFACFHENYDFKIERGFENRRYELFIYPSVAKALNLSFVKEKILL